MILLLYFYFKQFLIVNTNIIGELIMTNSIFKTKEHYFSFRDAWASAANNKKVKSQLEPCDEWIRNPSSISYGTGRYRVPGWLQAEHYILYNILRGRSFDRGFTPITNAVKLQHGMYINHGLFNGMIRLAGKQATAKKIVNNEKIEENQAQRFADFIEPFNNTVTVDMFASIILPEIKALYPNFGKSYHVAKQIINGDFKPINFKQVYTALAAAVV